MKKQEKLRLLRKFKENRLIDNVICPLLEKMGFKNITFTHGSLEKGKDLIFYKENEFAEREYTGVQVKAVKIHGRAGESGSATEILNQVQQAFTHEFQDIYDNKSKNIDRFIVITSGEITSSAKESINHQLKALGFYKSIRFFDGNKLVDLVDQWMPDFFWEEYNYFNRYFIEMKKDFETIKDISALGQKEAPGLEDIYVSLKLSETMQEQDLTGVMDKEIEVMERVEKIFDERLIVKGADRTVKRERVIDPDAAVLQFHRQVIMGVPGAGKTTLLKHLALKFCKENIELQERVIVPVFITLREFSQSGKGIRDYIDTVFAKYGFPEAGTSVENDLKCGKCILLLDGFDELASRENQQKVTEDIHDFANNYQRCKVLVTSRPAGYHDELSGFTRFEVMEFDDHQIKRFIENWFGESNIQKTQAILKAVMDNENIKTLARNPLMISIIAIIYEEDRELPQRRADLYRRSVDVLLSRWDKAKKLMNRYLPDKKEFVLKKLAFRSHCRNQRTISQEEILEEISMHSSRLGLQEDDIHPFLQEIWTRSYILRQISMDTYDFLHLSFQEYFTALELKEQEDGIGTIIKHIDEPWWEEPILLYAGISKDAGPLIERIQKEVPEDIFYSNLILCGKCIADGEFTHPKLKEEIIRKLDSLYNTGKFKLIKRIAVGVLRRVKPHNIIESLIKQLKDEDPGIRWHAAEVLGAIGSSQSIPVLKDVLKGDEDSSIRERAAEALGAIGGVEAARILKESLTEDEEPSVRARAAEALGTIGSSESIPVLKEVLKGDENSSVRERVAEALGAIGSADAIVLLKEILEGDESPIVRGYAAEALGAIGSPEAIPVLKKALTENKDSYVRWRAAKALGKIGSSEEITVLTQALGDDNTSLVRGSAAEALGALGKVEVIPLLKASLTGDKSPYVRGRAAQALGKIGDSEEIIVLNQALNNDNTSSVRWRAAEALGGIGCTEAISILLKALTTDKDTNVRCSAAEALGKVGNKTAIQPLKDALTDEEISLLREVKVKDAAYGALYKISRRLGVRVLPEENLSNE